MGADGVLAHLMQGAGFEEIESRTVPGFIRLPDAPTALALMQEAFGAYRAVVADLGPEEQARAWEDVQDCLRQFEVDGEFVAPIELLIVAGTRPA